MPRNPIVLIERGNVVEQAHTVCGIAHGRGVRHRDSDALAQGRGSGVVGGYARLHYSQVEMTGETTQRSFEWGLLNIKGMF